MHDYSLKDSFVWLRAEGMSFGEISRQLNVPKSTLIMWSHEKNWEISQAARAVKGALAPGEIITI